MDLSELNVDDTESAKESVEDKTSHKEKKIKTEEVQNDAANVLKMAKQFMQERVQMPCIKEETFCNYLRSLLQDIKLKETFDDVTFEILMLVRRKTEEEKHMLENFHNSSPVPSTSSPKYPLQIVMENTCESMSDDD